LATQQDVGLWPERRARVGVDHPDHSVADGTIVKYLIKFAGRYTPVAATAVDDE